MQRDIDRHEEVEQSYMNQGVRILELARNAQALFERQPAREKRHLLDFILSNCPWKIGAVVSTFRQSIDRLAETTGIAARSSNENKGSSFKNEIWLPFLNTYRTMCVAPEPDFRRLLEDIRELQIAA